MVPILFNKFPKELNRELILSMEKYSPLSFILNDTGEAIKWLIIIKKKNEFALWTHLGSRKDPSTQPFSIEDFFLSIQMKTLIAKQERNTAIFVIQPVILIQPGMSSDVRH